MTETPPSLLGISLGELIDTHEYDRVGTRANVYLRSTERAAWDLFVMGWSGLGYRSLAASEHLLRHRVGFAPDRPPTHLEHYRHDSEITGFIINATAATDALIFSLSILANCLHPNSLPHSTAKQLELRRGERMKALARLPADSPVHDLLLAFDALEAKVLFDTRDTLLHRGRLPRLLSIGGERSGKLRVPSNPKATPGEWIYDVEVDPHTLNDWAAWLREVLSHGLRTIDGVLGQLEALPNPDGATAITRMQLTLLSKRDVAKTMMARGGDFVGAALFLKREGGSGYTWRYLLCQGIELYLKGLLLLKDYDRFNPRLQKPLGHNLMTIADTCSKEYNIHRVSGVCRDQLIELNKAYLSHELRYASGISLLVDPERLECKRVMMRMAAVGRLTNRRLG